MWLWIIPIALNGALKSNKCNLANYLLLSLPTLFLIILISAYMNCSGCHADFSVNELIKLNSKYLCQCCKQNYVQMLKENTITESVSHMSPMYKGDSENYVYWTLGAVVALLAVILVMMSVSNPIILLTLIFLIMIGCFGGI